MTNTRFVYLARQRLPSTIVTVSSVLTHKVEFNNFGKGFGFVRKMLIILVRSFKFSSIVVGDINLFREISIFSDLMFSHIKFFASVIS